MQFRYVNGVAGAKCSQVLKKRVREEWEAKQTEPLRYVWGYDANESKRAERIKEHLNKIDHVFPLIDRKLSKDTCHGICAQLGIKRPAMYNLGYRNNNCVGCVKGGMGYWNRIRVDFPDVFERMSKLERQIGRSCINGVFLDELPPDRGRFENDIPTSCGMLCNAVMEDLDNEQNTNP